MVKTEKIGLKLFLFFLDSIAFIYSTMHFGEGILWIIASTIFFIALIILGACMLSERRKTR